MANYSRTPVFLKSDSVLGALLLNTSAHGNFVYDMVMSWMQNVNTKQAIAGLESEHVLLGVDFWESLKNGNVWWITVPGGLHVFTSEHGLDFGSAAEYDEWTLYYKHYVQCLEEHYSLVTTVEVSEPAQDWISQEMNKPHIRTLKEIFTDAQIRNGLQILNERGETVDFAKLLQILTEREDAMINDYVGTRRYAFSRDVQLVIHECHDIYGREPTHAEFDFQWNRIKEHLINQLADKDVEVTNINRDMDRLQERARLLNNEVTIEQARAVRERNRADQQHREKLDALNDVNIAMEARNEAQELADEAINGIIQEQRKARAFEIKAEEERARLEKEKEEVSVKLEEKEEERARLEKEKEEERARLEKEKEEERARLEKEKEEERARLEKEKEEERARLEKEKEEVSVKLEEKEEERARLEKEKEEERARLEKEKEEVSVKLEEKEEERARLEKEKEEERARLEKEKEEVSVKLEEKEEE
ncbi:calponin homology domain-containing protein DDB_G0272472-like, partial [Ylistrum balloti]|uniref:calponin homology domain-containing protein DDB_G0272472-like n=1 Tax=Ylistrum balloti TaxID=509963 RepID=UPI002905BCB0